MKGDFSRVTFDPARPFSRVLMQQGRVLVDADWNELNAVLLHYLRQLASDLIGPHGGPREEGVGFAITPGDERSGFYIWGGRYYVDGLPVQLASKIEGGYPRPSASYREQPYLPDPPKLPDENSYVVYLDVWERHVTAIENDAIREKALGGPDTASRAEIVWQARAAPLTEKVAKKLGNQPCANFPLTDFREELLGPRPLLRVRALRPPDADTDPCLTPPHARYRSNENQLYRVEIHSGGDGDRATFTWSRENGSVVARWLETRGKELVVEGIRDASRGFAEGNWVELLDDGRELRREPGTLARLARVEGEVLTVDPTAVYGDIAVEPAALGSPRVRRWDHHEVDDLDLRAGALPVEEGSGDNAWIPLEDGIEIQFQDHGTARPFRYRTGDYWLIPARVATGDVEWPRDPLAAERPAALPPHGIDDHYAPLLLVRPSGAFDLRRVWDALAACPAT
jgi:hypothetical protein